MKAFENSHFFFSDEKSKCVVDSSVAIYKGLIFAYEPDEQLHTAHIKTAYIVSDRFLSQQGVGK